MITRPSDPDGWYAPDAPVPEGMETTAEERAHWLSVYAGKTFNELPMLLRTLRDLDRALAEIARLTAINADLRAVNLRHAERHAAYETGNADGWREGAEAMRGECTKAAEGMPAAVNQPFPDAGLGGAEKLDAYTVVIKRDFAIARAIRALPIPSPPAEETKT